MQVEGQHEVSLLTLMATGARVRNTYPICPLPGERVRNTYPICPLPGDSLSKERLIPDGLSVRHLSGSKDLSAMDEDASD